MAVRHLTLLVPDLRPDPDCGELPNRLPALETLLSRADVAGSGQAGLEASLFAWFGITAVVGEDLPVASVSYTADTGQPPAGACLRADPVHLMPDRDQLVLLNSDNLDLQAAEALRLLAELNEIYAADGWRFEAPQPHRWYLHLPEMPRVTTQPLSSVSGQPIGRQLPAGEQGKAWHAAMNEIQMLLHTSGVNFQREADGRLSVSSVWFWGAGNTPSLAEVRWAQLWSDEPLGAGLAMLAGIPHAPAPATAQQWLSQAASGGEHLLVQESLSRALKLRGGEAWWMALQAFQRDWVEPLLDALRSKQIDSVQIDNGEGGVYRLDRRGLRRWWRRRKPLTQG